MQKSIFKYQPPLKLWRISAYVDILSSHLEKLNI